MNPDSDPNGVMSSSELVRNTQISVSIDDLAEGLIVVSFTHSNDVYQGVLFQLNRERGIPSGISFAKEQALGTEKAETDPSQVTPLHQRHSYNQGTGASHCSISQPSLRRVIKPPARFKNARMSLRLRARPVLCAKCKTLCDDKGDSSSKEDSAKDDNQNQTDKLKKDRVNKVTGKSDTTATTADLTLSGRSKGNEQTSATITDPADPKDLCYKSIGSARVVENYWKRPLVQPLPRSTEEVYSRLRKHKVTGESRPEGRKRAKSSNSANCSSYTIASCNNNSSQEKPCVSGNSSPSPAPTNSFLTKSTVCDRNFPNTRSRKALNLKMCITKLTEIRDNQKMKNGVGTETESQNHCSTSDDERPKCQVINSPTSPSDASSSESAEVFNSNSEPVASTSRSSRNSNKKQKAWGNRKASLRLRAKSTVPARYRDDLTKNIFNFNKRRPAVDGNDIPVLTLCRSDAASNSFKVSTTEAVDATVSTSKPKDTDEDQYSPDEDEDNESVAVSATTAPSSSSSPREDSISNSYEISSSPHSPTSSSNIPEPSHNYSIRNTCKMEMTKTPTIKITFGSSGKGMVVQIPPKDTQHVECSSTTGMKAARKAMKKAKKEARRKRSVSPDMSPSSNAISPSFAPRCERSNPGSPTIPLENGNREDLPDAELSTDCGSHPDFGALAGVDDDEEEESQPPRVPKKKKQKKKKRKSSKTLKENDCSTTSRSNTHDHVGFNGSSPYSNSSLNQDSTNYGRGSPGNVSVRSCNLATNQASTPDQLESFQSFSMDVPTRRRSVPASSTTYSSDTPKRVCINLKRIDTNAYVPLHLHSIPSQSDQDEQPTGNNRTDGEDSEPTNEYPVNASPSGNEADATPTLSNNCYKDKETELTYRTGDIVWGKLPALPWWPAKIIDIVARDPDETMAKVSWYKYNSESCVRFKMLVPFSEYFDSKYIRSLNGDAYQLAVRDALVEAHEIYPKTCQHTE